MSSTISSMSVRSMCLKKLCPRPRLACAPSTSPGRSATVTVSYLASALGLSIELGVRGWGPINEGLGSMFRVGVSKSIIGAGALGYGIPTDAEKFRPRG